MILSRLVIMAAAGAVVAALATKLQADVLYTSGQQDTSHTNFSYGSSDGFTGYGDDYSTPYTTVDLTGFSFYGGTTVSGEYVAIDFYNTAGVKVASISPDPSEVSGIGYHTLAATDFYQNGSNYVPITPSGYVIITPEVIITQNVNTGVTTQVPPVGVNASFTLGFGSAPTVGTNDPANSAMVYENPDEDGGSPILTTGDYVAGVNQYMQFELDGTGTLNSASGIWTSSSSGNWENSGNWNSSTIASGSAQTATFGTAVGSGSETVTLTANETVGTVAFTNSRGSYTIAAGAGIALTLDNGGSPAVINVKTLSQTITAPIVLADGVNINTAAGTLAAGSLTLGGAVTGTGPVTVSTSNSTLIISPTGAISVPLVNDGTVQFSAQSSGSSYLSRVIPSVTLAAGSTMTVAAAAIGVAPQVLVTGGLSLSSTNGSSTSKLDLANNDCIVQGGNLSVIRSQIKQGYNGGNWQGTEGITSSSAAASASHATALGVILNDNGKGTNTPLYSTFDGVSTGEGDVLIKYTWLGDTNLDGVVNSADLSAISPTGTTWATGDFNYDGVVNADDYALFMLGEAASAGTNISTIVPEPASVLLAGMSSFYLVGRRRRTWVYCK